MNTHLPADLSRADAAAKNAAGQFCTEVLADLQAVEDRKDAHWERRRAAHEAAELAKRPKPPTPVKAPNFVRLTRPAMIAGRLLPEGTLLRVVNAPEWPADALRADSAVDLIRSGRAESADAAAPGSIKP